MSNDDVISYAWKLTEEELRQYIENQRRLKKESSNTLNDVPKNVFVSNTNFLNSRN
jgi:uncharacterized protein (UPF0335 family)